MAELQLLLNGHRRRMELQPLVQAAERALRTWSTVWTGFVDASLREEAEQLLAPLSELRLRSDGGFRAAERRRLALSRVETAVEGEPVTVGAADPQGTEALMGLDLVGNFLFDPAVGSEFRELLQRLGAADEEIGDLWLRGDRGAQAVVLASLARRLDGQEAQLRSVPLRLESRPLAELRCPEPAAPRQIQTVEASLRLDALASAGYGMSRSRMADLIRQGAVCVNWQPVTSPSRLLAEGDRVQIEARGELRICRVGSTQRGRLRVEMRRGAG